MSNQLLPSGSVSDDLVFANVAEDGGPGFAILGTNEKDELMQAKKYILQAEFDESTGGISTVARAQITALEDRVRLLRQIEQADITVQKIYMERALQKFREGIYGEVMIPGPIHKLPGEMLSTIFRIHVEDDRSPWILVKVCKAWMHMAMRTPQLWCHLFLLQPEEGSAVNNQIQSYVVDGKVEHALGRMQVCFDKVQVHEALDRSGSVLPLSVKIFSHPRQDPGKLPASIFLRFITHPLSERLENLDIEWARDLKFEGDIAIGRFPLLRSMQLPYSVSPCIAKLLESVSMTSQALETAIFRCGISPPAVAYPFWARLKCFTIQMGTVDVLNQLVDQLGGIERLDSSVRGWPDRQTPRSVLGNIQELTLDCSLEYLGRLQLPHMKTLRFISKRQYEQDTSNYCTQLSYPMVENLVLSTPDTNWHLYTAGAFPAVQNLSLTWRGDDVMPINILQTMPSVRNVTIGGSSSSITFGILLMKALQSPDEPVLCANLEKLYLGDSVRTPKAMLIPGIKKLVQFRNNLGRPFQELTVRWSDEDSVDYAAV